MNSKINKLIIHITGCLALLSLPLLYTPSLSSELEFIRSRGFQRDLVFSIFLILFFYLSYFILVPKLYFNKKYIYFFSISVICFLFIICSPSFLKATRSKSLFSIQKSYSKFTFIQSFKVFFKYRCLFSHFHWSSPYKSIKC